MSRRISRDFDALSEAQIVAGRMTARTVDPASLVRAANPKAVADLLDTIQQVAEAATGDRSFLHLRRDTEHAGAAPRPPSLRSARG